MQVDPGGADLLDAALALLRSEVLHAVPTDKRHAVLMIANAVAIVTRQLRAADDAEEDQLRALLAPGPTDASHGEKHLGRELASRIRQGNADPGTQRCLPTCDFLRAVTLRRIMISCPKALEA